MSDDWENSDTEDWPRSRSRYAPFGDATSKVSSKGSTRLATEFTMGTGFHHLNKGGNEKRFSALRRTSFLKPLPTCGLNDDSSGETFYSNPAIELMEKNDLSGTGLMLGKQCYLEKVLLVTDAPHAIKLYIGDDDGPCVVGMAMMRDGIIFTSGVLSEKFCKPLVLQLDPKKPIIDSIEMQCCTWLKEKHGKVSKKITYLNIQCGSDEMVFGEPIQPGFDGDRSIYVPSEHAEGNLCICGIGYFDSKPISLQVADLGSDCKDVVDAMDTNVYYNNGVISGNIARSRLREVEFLGSITTEQDDVWNVLLGCMDAVEHSSPSYGELLPNVVDLLEGSLQGDIEAIHSVLRMDRFLTHTIHQKKKIRTFENDKLNFYAKLIPMKQMWGTFSNTIERIKRVHTYQPVMNSFNVGFLEGTKAFFWHAVFIYLTQVSLLLLTVSHIWARQEIVLQVPSLPKLAVSICGTIVVSFLAKNFTNNFFQFSKIFPEYIGTTLYYLDALSNVFGGFVVTGCTFFLLMMAENNLDVVLNATALLFVLELDEMMVDSNPIYTTSIYRAYFMKAIIKDLNESDQRYWDPSYLRKNRGEHYRIHLPSCSFLFSNK